MKARLEAAAAWFKRGASAEEPAPRPRVSSGTQYRCTQCADGKRTCGSCLGQAFQTSAGGVKTPCAPCGGKGRVRCQACRGEAYVRGY